jgi:hypothetical protein
MEMMALRVPPISILLEKLRGISVPGCRAFSKSISLTAKGRTAPRPPSGSERMRLLSP